MAKYIVTDGTTVIGPYDDGKEAFCSLTTQLAGCLASGATPVMWHIEEVADAPEKAKDVPDLIPDYEAARLYLGADRISQTITASNWHAVEAFNQLLTICEAWNRADGFEPDWTNNTEITNKYYPVFSFGEKGIFIPNVEVETWHVRPFVFKTKERARQFGEQFIDLFRQFYSIEEGE